MVGLSPDGTEAFFSPVTHSARLCLYGTHDTTILLFLLALDIFDGQWPPYCANLTFELVDQGAHDLPPDSRYRVRVLYNLQPVALRIADDPALPDSVSLGTCESSVCVCVCGGGGGLVV